MSEISSTQTPNTKHEHELAAKHLVDLGRFAVNLAGVVRAPRLPDGRRENDVEHSYHLTLSAVELAARFYPNLDKGLLALFSIMHDAVEVKTGDVWTFSITDEARELKEVNEKLACHELLQELPPFWADILKRYEEQTEPEARFVRLVDKIMPAVINMLDDPATSTFLNDHGVDIVEQLSEQRIGSGERLRRLFPEFNTVHMVREIIVDQTTQHYFPKTSP